MRGQCRLILLIVLVTHGLRRRRLSGDHDRPPAFGVTNVGGFERGVHVLHDLEARPVVGGVPAESRQTSSQPMARSSCRVRSTAGPSWPV